MSTSYILNYGIEIECFLIKTEKFIEYMMIDYILELDKFIEINKTISVYDDEIIDNEYLNLIFTFFNKEEKEYITNADLLENKIKIIEYIKNKLIDIFNDQEDVKKFICKYLNIEKYKFSLKDTYYQINQIEISKDKHIDIVDDIKDKYICGTKKDKDVSYIVDTDLSVSCYKRKDKSIFYNNIKDSNITKLYYYDVISNTEFVSGIFRTKNDVKNGLNLFFDYLKDIFGDDNVLLNSSETSNHIHFSFNNNDKVILKPDINFILVFVCLYYIIEPLLFNFCIKSRTDNKYCKAMKPKLYDNGISLEIFNGIEDYNEKLNKIMETFFVVNDRYNALNLQNLITFNIGVTESKPTIELRIKHGSNDAEEIYKFCELIEIIVNISYKIYEKLKEKENIFELIEKETKLHSTIQEYIKTKTKKSLNKILDILYTNIEDKEYWINHIEQIKKINLFEI